MSIALVFLLASLQGLVVRAGTADGVPKAIVELRLVDDTTAAPYLTTTLIDGGFSFHNLKPGRYRLSASRNGYVSNGAGSTITLTENDALTNFRIAMTLAGAVYGHVYDQKQHLLAGADVQAMKLSYEGGRSVLKFIQSATTNDLGEYRLFGLAPGRYYISALHPDGGRYRPPSGLVPGPFTGFFAFGRRPITSRRLEPRPAGTYVPIFFSDTPDEQDARPIDLAAGSEFGGADITVFPVPRRVVRGVIMDGTTGQAARNARLFVSRSPARVNDNPYIGVDSTGGSFEVSSLLPGSYTFVATAGALTGRNTIEIGDDDVNDITIRLAPGFNVAGRVTMDGGGSPPEGFRVSLRPDPDIRDLKLPGPPENGLVSSDGSFSLLAVPPGDYQLNVTLPPGLQGTYVKSVRLGAVDVLSDGLRITSQPDELLQVIVGTNPGALVGRIVNAEHEPVPGVIAVLVPDLNERTRVDLYHSGSSDASGRFRFDGLAPGDYKLFAWEEVESEAWTDTEFLRSQEDQGTPVRIIEGTLVGAEAILILSRP